jgi:hypothetical protein
MENYAYWICRGDVKSGLIALLEENGFRRGRILRSMLSNNHEVQVRCKVKNYHPEYKTLIDLFGSNGNCEHVYSLIHNYLKNEAKPLSITFGKYPPEKKFKTSS